MIWKVDTYWLVMAIIIVTMISYLFGYALDRIMNSDGFGPAGNMVFLVIGFFGGIYLANMYGIRFRNLQLATGAGVIGGFFMMTFMAVLKGIFYRTG